MSGLKASAMPVAIKLPAKMYIGHSHPSGSGFSPGLMPQSQPVGGSNWLSLPWPPPCLRAVREKDRAAAEEEAVAAGARAQHRTARVVCRRRAIVCIVEEGSQ